MRETKQQKEAALKAKKLKRLKTLVGQRPVYTNANAKLDMGQAVDNAKKRCSSARATAYEMHPDTAQAIGATVKGDLTDQRSKEVAAAPGTDAHKEAAELADQAKDPGRKVAKEARLKAIADAKEKATAAAVAKKAKVQKAQAEARANAATPPPPVTEPGAPPSGAGDLGDDDEE